jgi:2-methylcitrate dehydratase PrpD
MQVQSTFTTSLAARNAYLRPPPEVVARATLHLLDAVGCGLAAHALGEGVEARAVVAAQGGEAAADVIGAARLPAPSAALANGTLIHALDFDDTHPGAICHITTVVAPAAFAMAQARGSSGAEMVAAYIAGCETVARIGAAAEGRFHLRGFHPTGVCGVFGATVAAARLAGLGREQTVQALGIAASFAPGILEFLGDGSTTKRLHAGGAAQAGVLAALLAEAGACGPASALEGRYGLFRTHLDMDAGDALRAQIADLGERWETMAMAIKPYPACHFMHGCLEATERLVATHGVTAEDVRGIHVRVAEPGVGLILEPAAAKPAPQTPYDAKFSLPFSLAALLERGHIDVTTYTAASLGDPALEAIGRRVTYESLPLAEVADAFGGEVELELDGRRVAAAVPVPLGGTGRAMGEADVLRKFTANARLALDEVDAAALAAEILDLPSRPDVAGILSRPGGPPTR